MWAGQEALQCAKQSLPLVVGVVAMTTQNGFSDSALQRMLHLL